MGQSDEPTAAANSAAAAIGGLTIQSHGHHPEVARPAASGFTRSKFEELMKKKFFYAPAFGIYGGVAGLFDYGPPCTAIQANIVNEWRRHFVLEEGMLEVDCTMLTPYEVLKTSGHVDRFADYMVKDNKTGEVFRADHLVEAALEAKLNAATAASASAGKKDGKHAAAAAEQKTLTAAEVEEVKAILAQLDNYDQAGLQGLIDRFALKSEAGNDLGPVHPFNLMFGTEIGPTGYLKGFLRPETAQGQFVNFKRLLEYNNHRMPFASATIGKSFRNEISPRAGLLRVREFLMAEIEHYVHPQRKSHPKFSSVAECQLKLLPRTVQLAGSSDLVSMTAAEAVSSGTINNETLAYFLVRVQAFLLRIGIAPDRLRFRQHLPNEMAHYASDCWDAEIACSYGWIECVGCADRAAYDLTVHTRRTRERLMAQDRLTEPMEVERTKAIINKKLLGQTFRTDSRVLIEHLESLEESDLESMLSTSSSSADSTRSITVAGKTFELSSEMFRVERVKECTHTIEYIPNVIEPSFGLGRIIYCLLEHAYWVRPDDADRAVLSLAPLIAPVKCVVLPLSNGDAGLDGLVAELADGLRRAQIAFDVDDSGASIGKRYARNDELGVPFFVTVDFQSVFDRTVTLRERDSTKQIRLPVADVPSVLAALCNDNSSDSKASVQSAAEGAVQAWHRMCQRYPLFVAQQEK